MQPNFIQQKKKQKYMIFVLLAVLLVTFYVIWQGFFKQESLTNVVATPVVKEEEPFSVPEVRFDVKILDNPLLKELTEFSVIQSFKESTSTKEVIGRGNPFLPY